MNHRLLLVTVLGSLAFNAWADPNPRMENQFANIDALIKAMEAAGSLPVDTEGSGPSKDVGKLKQSIMRNLDEPVVLAFLQMDRLIKTTSDEEWKLLDVHPAVLGTRSSWAKRMVTHYLKYHQDLDSAVWSYFLPHLFTLDEEVTQSVFRTVSERDRKVILRNLRADWNRDFRTELLKIR